MRDYDDLRSKLDMSFIICGEKFVLGPCSASQYAKWEETEDKQEMNGKSTAQVIIDMTSLVLLDLMTPEDGKRWKALLKRKDGPTIAELSDLRRWVIEVQTDLPTSPPASSEAGRAATVASSKGA